jgi:hypothetical protein
MNRQFPKRKHWQNCPVCHQDVFTIDFSNHKCPDKVKARREAELDMVVDEEMSTWEQDLKKFWNSNDTKFHEWLVEHNRY